MPSWLVTTQEKQNFVHNMGLWIFCIVSPILFLFHPCSTQPKDTHQGFWLSFLCMRTHQISRKVPSRSPTYALLYMLFILQFKPPLCIISPWHQPFINPNYSKNTKLAMTQSLVQRKSNSNYRFLQAPPFTQTVTISIIKMDLSFFALKLLFLYSSNNILSPVSLACLQCPWPFIVCCQPVSHNTQTTKFPTHNHKQTMMI